MSKPKSFRRTLVRSSVGAIGVIDDTPAAGNLVAIDQPKFISLVGKPANQRPFTVIRSDDERPNNDGKAAAPRISRQRRSDNPVLAVTFPESFTEADAAASLEAFGMSSYTVKRNEKNLIVAMRSDLQSIAETGTTQIKLNADGVMATVEAKGILASPATKASGITVVRMEFDANKYDSNEISAWLLKNNIDNGQVAAENPGNEFVTVKRHDVSEGIETRKIEIEDGVFVVITRSEGDDIPECCANGVVEAAYGNWGWGQLDFSAAMADDAFCDVFYEAMESLRSVMSNIMMYSSLPLDSRKQLVVNATTQFAAFINNAIDALPRQVLLLTRSDAATKENQSMNTVAQAAVAAPAVVAPAEAQAAAPAAAESVTISRTDLQELIRSEIAADRAAQAAAATPAATVAAVEASAAAPAESQVLTRADIEAAVTAATAPLLERLERSEATTVVRSDNMDPAPVSTEKKTLSREDLFKGALFGNMVQK